MGPHSRVPITRLLLLPLPLPLPESLVPDLEIWGELGRISAAGLPPPGRSP